MSAKEMQEDLRRPASTGTMTATSSQFEDRNNNYNHDNIDDDDNEDDDEIYTGIQRTFDQIVTYMRHHNEIGPLLQAHLSTDEQLQLYGLYKQSTTSSSSTSTYTTVVEEQNSSETTIASSSSVSSSWWNYNPSNIVRDQTKRRAWERVQHLTPHHARKLYLQRLIEYTKQYEGLYTLHEYIIMIQQQHHHVSFKVRTTGRNDNPVVRVKNYTGTAISELETTGTTGGTADTRTAVIEETLVVEGTLSTPSKNNTTNNYYNCRTPSSNTNHPLPIAAAATSTSSNSQSWIQQFIIADILGISPLQPRGTLDISYSDLYFAFRQCVYQLLLPLYGGWSPVRRRQQQQRLYQQYDNDIQTRWIQAWYENQQSRVKSNVDVVQQHQPPSVPNHITGSTVVPNRSSDGSANAATGAIGLDVIIGYSVRSLLDIYLQVQQYPPHSELIICPPITVPGMMTVLQHYQIKVVGVDVPTNTNMTTNDDDQNDIVLSINLDGIQKAITTKTVAVMIVHVFGMIVASNHEMEQLRSIIHNVNNNHSEHHHTPSQCITIIEDCAECFTGLHHQSGAYLGSPYADISFFSFGMIKTMTSIHGGIAIIWKQQQQATVCDSKNENNIISCNRNDKRHFQQNVSTEAMIRVQQSYFNEQSNIKYLQQVCKCLILKWISGSPLLYGLIYTIVAGIGLNFDRFVTALLRGFPMEKKQMMYQMRQRPSVAMLAVLRRRLYQGSFLTSTTLRIKLCQQLTDRIKTNRPQKMKQIRTIAPKDDCDNYYWLYPILVNNRDVVSKYLRRCGFDATGGTSQLCCVSSSSECPIANQAMSSLLYLPIDTYSNCTSPLSQGNKNNHINVMRLSQALRSLPQNSVPDGIQNRNTYCPKPNSLRQRTIIRLIPIGLLLLRFWFVCIPIVVFVLQVIICWSIIYFTLIWLLRIKMGNFYLESSSGFAKYNYLLNQETRSDHNDLKEGGILAGMASLQLPVTVTGTEKRTVLLTGATGFVGSMLLRDLLFHRKALNIECVVILCRAKKSKTATERVESMLGDAMYSFLSISEKKTLVKVIEGDVTLPRAGLSDEAITSLVQHAHVTHIINCAASVSFTQSLPDAATANIRSSLNVQSLGSIISKERIQFVHVSTAFVHGGCFGDNGEPLLEDLYSLGRFDPVKIYKSMTETQFFASKAMSELSFPNTYTFSKCVAEHLLLSNDPTTIIVRPSIIGPAVEFPFEGWAGRIPSTIVAAACLYLTYQWNIWSFGRHKVPIVPIDVVSRFIVSKAFGANLTDNNEACSVDDSSCDESYDKISHSSSTKETSSTATSDSERRYQIFNATWDDRSPDSSSFTWFQYAGAVTQVGCVMGYFSHPIAYFGLLFATKLIPKMKLSMHRFATVHDWCVKHPFDWITHLTENLGFDVSRMRHLYAYLNLPLLFYPFMNNSYHFHSELIAPSELSGEHYLMMCVSAAHNFIQKSRVNRKKEDQQSDTTLSSHLSLLQSVGLNNDIRGSSLSWAISQPHGNILVRISGWLLVHVLKRCFTEISVDVQSLAVIAQKKTDSSCTILAPTHRSIFDSLILTLVCFSVPELQIGMPSIAAADLFERLPLIGCLLHFLGVFFVRRGRMSVDPNLTEAISSLRAKSFRRETVVELFVEGTRSRDRRFVKPKTGVLRCLFDPSCQQTIVPITINYERIAEQESLVKEASGRLPSGLHVLPMLSWLFNVLRGRIKLGRVHIAACEPISFDDLIENEMNDVVHAIQTRQANSIYTSDYHIYASSKVLGLDATVVHRAFDAVGVKFFPTCSTKHATPIVPSNESENLSILFQVSPLLAPLFKESRPHWSQWLWDNPGSDVTASEVAVLTNLDVQELIKAILVLFDKADQCVDAAVKILIKNGFTQPRSRHILQAAMNERDDVPALLLQASIEIRFRSEQSSKTTKNVLGVSSVVRRPKVGADEALGYWGFYESQFVLHMDSDGSTFVRMDGNHYSLRGKKISGLLSFMETETTISVDPLDEAFSEQSQALTTSRIMIHGSALDSLKSAVSKISQISEDRIRHGTGHSQEDVFLIRSKGVLRVPDVVVYPVSELEVESVIKLAHLHQWCIIPFGGGTNVTNALRCPPLEVESRPIVSLDMRDMCQILWIDEENGIAHVQAGITGRQLEKGLAIRGYTMGHEPDSIEFSTLGGWIATKASGMKRSKYGNIEDIVKSVRVMGPEGALKHGSDEKRHVWGRESCGIDLRNLVLGSEGCMGVITSAFIRICPLPESKEYDCILFNDFHVGLRFIREVVRLGSDCPASVRLLDNEHFRLGHALRPDSNSIVTSFVNLCFGTFVKWKANFDSNKMVCVTLMYEGRADEVKRQKRAVNRTSGHYGGERLGSAAGKASYELTFMIAYIRDFALSYHFLGESFETFAPWSQIETIVTETKAEIRQEHTKRCLPGRPFIGCRVTQLYHEGACLYFYFCMNFEGVQNASSVYNEIEHAAHAVILANGGSLSHHHGIGKLRASFLSTIDSAEFRGVITKIKHAVDPGNIFGARNGGFSYGITN